MSRKQTTFKIRIQSRKFVELRVFRPKERLLKQRSSNLEISSNLAEKCSRTFGRFLPISPGIKQIETKSKKNELLEQYLRDVQVYLTKRSVLSNRIKGLYNHMIVRVSQRKLDHDVKTASIMTQELEGERKKREGGRRSGREGGEEGREKKKEERRAKGSVRKGEQKEAYEKASLIVTHFFCFCFFNYFFGQKF